MKPTGYAVRSIGCNRGAPRIWLEGRLPASAGLLPGARFRVLLDKEAKRIVLRVSADGERQVSRKERGGRTIPVVDINSAQALAIFAGLGKVRVWASTEGLCIAPLATETRAQRRLERLKAKLRGGLPLAIGSVAHGGGVLSKAIHDGLERVRIATKLVFANDIREDLLDQAAEHNPAWDTDTIMLAAPMQELAFDHRLMGSLPEVDVLEGGIPCSGASVAGRAKNATSCAEAHEQVGHLVVAFLAIIARVNPAVVVLENVPPYQSSASMWIIRHQLRDLGYDVHETVLDSSEWNAIEVRRRMCMVATTRGMAFSTDAIARPAPVATRLGDVLENVSQSDASWSEMAGLRSKQARDAAAGKGFRMQIVNAESSHVGTIGKGYAKNRSTEPKVQHPTDPRLLRMLTPSEHAGVKGIDPALVAGLNRTTAHELLGQSVVPAPFVAAAMVIGTALKALIRPGAASAGAAAPRPRSVTPVVTVVSSEPEQVELFAC